MNRTTLFSLMALVLLARTAEAAPMQRLVRVVDATTVVVERDGLETAIALAGVDVPPARRAETIAWLQTLTGSWILVEGGNVYRSPDGAFVNAELRRRLGADAAPIGERHPMTILGVAAPGLARSARGSGAKAAPANRAATPKHAPARPQSAHRRRRAPRTK